MARVNSSIKILTFSFFLIFFGFNGVQQYLTVFFLEQGISVVGFYSLIIIYVLFSLSSPIAGAVVSKYGPKKAMVTASLFYGFFMLALLPGSTFLVYLGSAFLGVAAAFLWNGQNIYLLKESGEDSSGKGAGFFMVVFSLGTMLGILTIWYFQQYFSLGQIFFVFSFFPFLGFLSLLALPAVASAPIPNKFTLMKRSLMSPTALRFSLLWFGLAFVNGLAVGFLPVDIKNMLGIQLVGPLSTLFYIIPLLCSYFIGKVSDKISRKPLIILSLALGGGSLIFLWFGETLGLMTLGITLLTLYYSILRTITFALVGDISTPANLGSLNSLFWAIQNVGTVAALLLALLVPGKAVYLVSLAFVIISGFMLYPSFKYTLPEAKDHIEREMGIVQEERESKS